MPFGIDLMPKLRGLGKRPLSLEVRIQPNIPDVVQWGNGAPRPLRSSYLHIPQHGPRGRDPRETVAQGDGHAISSATAAFTSWPIAYAGPTQAGQPLSHGQAARCSRARSSSGSVARKRRSEKPTPPGVMSKR